LHWRLPLYLYRSSDHVSHEVVAGTLYRRKHDSYVLFCSVNSQQTQKHSASNFKFKLNIHLKYIHITH